VPIWLGESGENTNEWFRECVALVEKHGIGWPGAAQEAQQPEVHLHGDAPDDFKRVVDYWNGEVSAIA